MKKRQRGFIDEELLFVSTLGLLLIAAFIGVFWLLAEASAKEQRAWDAFKTEHQCKIVGQVRGHTGFGNGFAVDANGNVNSIVTTTYTPPKTGWQCNDGVTYWR